MGNATITNILLDLLIFVPTIILGVYLSLYCGFHFSYYKKIEDQRLEIRTKILDFWTTRYKTLEQFFSEIPLGDIRLVALSDKRKTNRFRTYQCVYTAFSLFSPIMAIIFKNIQDTNNALITFYISSVYTGIFLLFSYFLGTMSYYEWKFYNRLDKLDAEITTRNSKLPAIPDFSASLT